MRHLLPLLFSCATLSAALAQSPFAGDWYGTLALPDGNALALVFHIAEGADGELESTLDSPDQGAAGLTIGSMEVEGGTLVLRANQLGLSYEGTLDETGQRLSGTFRQGGLEAPLTLTAAPDAPAGTDAPDATEGADVPAARPQDPVDFPYTRDDVTVPAGAHDLAGTLTLPADGRPSAAVVLVSGSGPQDRDEALLGHRPFLVLSDYLTRRGVAVLRYDDRGVGASGGTFAGATTADFVEDAAAAVRSLRSDERLLGLPVGVIGHSEGGMVAPLLARRHPGLLDFAVLLAGPGIPIDSLLILQTDRSAELSGTPAELRTANRAVMRAAFAYLEAHPQLDSAAAHEGLTDEIARAVETHFPEETRAQMGDLRAFAKTQASTFVEPWFRWFVAYDPAAALRAMDIPTLALFGALDAQVTPVENAAGMKAALPPTEGTEVRILPGLNHLFQPATTGAASEYGSIDVTIDETALTAIGEWIASVP